MSPTCSLPVSGGVGGLEGVCATTRTAARRANFRGRANSAQTRQSKPDSGLVWNHFSRKNLQNILSRSLLARQRRRGGHHPHFWVVGVKRESRFSSFWFGSRVSGFGGRVCRHDLAYPAGQALGFELRVPCFGFQISGFKSGSQVLGSHTASRTPSAAGLAAQASASATPEAKLRERDRWVCRGFPQCTQVGRVLRAT